jgi:hypothetical protein
MLLKLKQKNEERAIKVEQLKASKEEELESRREKFRETMRDTREKFKITLDMKFVEVQRKAEERSKKEEIVSKNRDDIT